MGCPRPFPARDGEPFPVATLGRARRGGSGSIWRRFKMGNLWGIYGNPWKNQGKSMENPWTIPSNKRFKKLGKLSNMRGDFPSMFQNIVWFLLISGDPIFSFSDDFSSFCHGNSHMWIIQNGIRSLDVSSMDNRANRFFCWLLRSWMMLIFFANPYQNFLEPGIVGELCFLTFWLQVQGSGSQSQHCTGWIPHEDSTTKR